MSPSLAPELPKQTAEQVLALLEACCVSVGYATDTARFETKDALQADVPKLVAMLRRLDDHASEKLLVLAMGHANPWVRYFAAINVASEHAIEVAGVLARLREEPSLVSAAAMLSLHQLQNSAAGKPPALGQEGEA